jgi:acid phosphatase family membrane protein YuiD
VNPSAAFLLYLRAELPPEHPASETTILKETLGHTPVQVVAGAGVGLLVGLILISLLGLIGALPGAAAAAAAASPRPGL